MTAPFAHLQRLVTLAQEPSSDKRRELLREVTDLFLERPQERSAEESEHFGAIMGKVAADMEVAVRAHLAERLSNVPTAPRSLIVQLANDAIEVARPLLMKSLSFEDTDLVALAKLQGQSHLQALSQRANVPAAVTDVIVARADDATLEVLVQNQTAALSRSALETMVSRAEKNTRLQGPLAQRRELPADLMHEMFLFVSSSLKKMLMERIAGLDEAAIDEALVVAQQSGRMKAATPDFAKAEQIVAQKRRDRTLNERFLTETLRGRDMALFVAAFAALAEIDTATARRLVSDPAPEGLAIACKAARFDRATFSTIVLNADPRRTRDPSEVNALVALYDKIPVDTALRTMRFWKVRRQTLQADGRAAEA